MENERIPDSMEVTETIPQTIKTAYGECRLISERVKDTNFDVVGEYVLNTYIFIKL